MMFAIRMLYYDSAASYLGRLLVYFLLISALPVHKYLVIKGVIKLGVRFLQGSLPLTARYYLPEKGKACMKAWV